MANLTKTLKLKDEDYDERTPIHSIMKRISLADLAASGTDNLIDIPAESAVVSCTIISRVAAVGGTSIKIVFNGADIITAAIGIMASLATGDVIEGVFTASNEFYVTAADTIDSTTVGTFSAGEIDLHVGYITVLDNT